VSGYADESRFTDEACRDPRVRELSRRIDVVADPDLGIYDSIARVAAEGREWHIEKNTSLPAFVQHPDEQTARLLAKFHSLAGPVLGADRAGELADAVMNLDGSGAVGELIALTRPVEAAALARSTY
jgi:hypothetical protein